jgi:hypothetical protein
LLRPAQLLHPVDSQRDDRLHDFGPEVALSGGMHTTRMGPDIEYRFNYSPESATCPSCGTDFVSTIGMWPFRADVAKPVCGGRECPAGAMTLPPDGCDTVVRLIELAPTTVAALRDLDDGIPVAERFRTVSLEPQVPEADRRVLQLAAIDLQYCQATGTRIEAYEPRLVLRTCGEAAGELLLSGCAEIAGAAA